MIGSRITWVGFGLLCIGLASSCGDGDARQSAAVAVQSCMTCHNGSQANDYGGPGLQDPHPFGAAANMLCTECHGGDPSAFTADTAHVPPPPEIGDREFQRENREAFFNRLTLTGLDKLPDYEANGTTYTAIDYLQFVNPGDLRVVNTGRSCGQCHAPHAESVSKSALATETGVLSGALFAAGLENSIPEHRGLFEDTAAEYGFRDVEDPDHAHDPAATGVVGQLNEFPVNSVRGDESPNAIFRNDEYAAALLEDDVNADNQCVAGSELANLYQEQIAFTCGDCHLGSAGANNRAGDFRSSGCTACHMPYSLSGRHEGNDPNVPLNEPEDPDDIEPGELAHVRSHRIVSVKKTLANGQEQLGMDDLTCAGCHQGSNRTVMQYWGIRLDQNQDVRRGNQYPANPADYEDTRDDERLFDPDVGNRTFNGRNPRQYLAFEDYDGDGRDDTPEDVHHQAGMGCIDCHGSYDLHGGNVAEGGQIISRMEHGVAVQCENCHGSVESYASTTRAAGYDGELADLGVDNEGNTLRHVYKDERNHYWLRSKLTGRLHYITQTRDVVVNNARENPLTGERLYTDSGSYAMGRADGSNITGTGPIQEDGVHSGFSHMDNMSCASCHSSWTNSCIGCHLEGEYNEGNNFSNITGERIVFRERNADFVYQSPVFFQLGVGPKNRIDAVCANTKAFFKYRDRRGDFSKVFAFSDRHGKGNEPGKFGALGHNAMMAHSIRGRVSETREGPRYCVACHMTESGLGNYRAEYDAFRTAMATSQFGDLDFDVLRQHFGQNTGNEMDSPLWVHMVAGLGTGLFMFDENGCAVNPLDENDDRVGCEGQAPADTFDPARVRFNLDRIVDTAGDAKASSNHPLMNLTKDLRDGASDPNMAGPLGRSLIQRLTDPDAGIVLKAWLGTDGQPRGTASTWVKDR